MSDIFEHAGATMLLACVAGLWVAVFIPSWVRARNDRQAARRVERMHAAMTVLARTEGIDDVEDEVSARRALALARQAKKAQRDEVRTAAKQARERRLEQRIMQQSRQWKDLTPAQRARYRRGRALAVALMSVAFVAAAISIPQMVGQSWGWSWVLASGVVFGLLGAATLRTATRVAMRERITASQGDARVKQTVEHSARRTVRPASSAEARQEMTKRVAADRSGSDADEENRTWTPHDLPKPLGVTRAEVMAAALAEAAAAEQQSGTKAEGSVDTGTRPADAKAANAGVAEAEDDYSWVDERTGLDRGLDAERLDDILRRRRNVG